MNKPPFELGERLKACADFVRNGSRVADIGTDHAYLPIWLVKNNIAKFAIAADVNSGPLESARKNVEKYKVPEFVDFRLSDGLEKIGENEVDDIIIAGMGGELIKRIIFDAPWLANTEKSLILQPMSSVAELRLALLEKGIKVFAEKAVIDCGKVYSIFRCSYVAETLHEDELFQYMGKIEPNSPAAADYAEKTIKKLRGKALGFSHTGEMNGLAKLEDIIKKISEKYLQG